MLTASQVTLAANLPPAYRRALDQHCRRVSRHKGSRPTPERLMALTAWSGSDHPERVAMAKAISQAEASLTAVERAAEQCGDNRYLDQLQALAARIAALRVEAGELGRLIGYGSAFETMMVWLRSCVSDDILALLDAGPERLRAEAIQRAELAHRTEDETGLVGAALVEHRRRCCARTQARRLRRSINAARLTVGVVLGEIGQLSDDRTQLYAPDVSVTASRQRDAASKAWAENYVLTDGDKLAVSMATIMKEAAKRRFNTLWSLTRACEQIAERQGLACLFVTLSLPPKFHRNPSKGRRGSWQQGQTPVAGIEELQHRWRLVRARLRKSGVDQLGLWTQEPHEDATPHRHLLIWTAPADVARLVAIYRSVFAEEREELEGGVAVNVKRWDPKRAGKASSYVMKYLTKTFAGGEKQVDRKEGTERHLENAERVTAWRRGTPGKRSYDFFGLKAGAIGVWAKVASLREKASAMRDVTFGSAHAEIESGKFGDALERLGLLAADEVGKHWRVEKEVAISSFGEPYPRPVRLHSDTGGEIELRSGLEIVSKEEFVRRSGAASGGKARPGDVSVSGVAVVVNYPRGDAGAPPSALLGDVTAVARGEITLAAFHARQANQRKTCRTSVQNGPLTV